MPYIVLGNIRISSCKMFDDCICIVFSYFLFFLLRWLVLVYFSCNLQVCYDALNVWLSTWPTAFLNTTIQRFYMSYCISVTNTIYVLTVFHNNSYVFQYDNVWPMDFHKDAFPNENYTNYVCSMTITNNYVVSLKKYKYVLHYGDCMDA